MIYTIYEKETGRILTTVSGDEEQINRYLEDKDYVEGEYHGNYYINNGIPELKSTDPSNYPIKYNFDYVNKTWVLNTVISSTNIRSIRNQELSVIDNVNGIRYASLTEEQRQELANYRQALLDVPQQSTFPETVVWPTKPNWL